VIQEYIQKNESKVILLTATPYNKTYLDLSNQLRLFIPEDQNIGVRPEQLLGELGETEFIRRHQCALRSLAAFEKSEYADDWRELMRLYMVRRTRSFITANYANTDCAQCGAVIEAAARVCPQCKWPVSESDRRYLVFEDGRHMPFPTRKPRTVKFKIDDNDPNDQYAQLYAPDVVDIISHLNLPRYGLGNYVANARILHEPPTPAEQKALQDLSRAGKRLMGFCRTNLFKRLESSGQAFVQSVERHILRNYIYLHAIEKNKPLPIGTQDAGLLDARVYDEDADAVVGLFDEDDEQNGNVPAAGSSLRTEKDFKQRAAEIYAEYEGQFKRRFKWLRPNLFRQSLADDLRADAQALVQVLHKCSQWNPRQDAKLDALYKLLTRKHPKDKVLIFTQFADTVRYLEEQLAKRGISRLAGATGDLPDPTGLAWRFSPESNEKRGQIKPEDVLRVLVATDVLSEGQNLQDCFVVVNYDLPWAIIRLIQRAGRVDRIGQTAEDIFCYSFLPAEGVERIIRLRARVRQRLHENAEVVGTDEAFFEDDRNDEAVVDLYNEKAGILDGEEDTEVDLASYAYQIWKNAIATDPTLRKVIPDLPPVVFTAKPHAPTNTEPEGVLVYLRTAEGNDALAWVDQDGNSVTESQFAILKAAECLPDTPALPRHDKHHELVQTGVELVMREEKSVGGALGRPSGARFRTYERLKRYAEEVKGTLFDSQELRRAIDEIYRYPLRQSAADTLNRQLRSSVEDTVLAQLVITLRDEDRLCLVNEEEHAQAQKPRIICSMGLRDA
jgi:hypothetical protein